MMKTRKILLIVLVLLAGNLLGGCNPAEAAAPVVDIQVAPVSTDTGAPSAAPANLRPVARAILSGSITDRLELVEFLTVGCTFADGLGGPPKCTEGQEEGELVEVFPVGGSEGSFATRETIEQTLDFTVIGLTGVYAVPADAYSESFWPAGDYGLIFSRTLNEVPMPITVLVSEGKIVRLQFQFGISAEDQLNSFPVAQVLVPPAGVDAWLNGGN